MAYKEATFGTFSSPCHVKPIGDFVGIKDFVNYVTPAAPGTSYGFTVRLLQANIYLVLESNIITNHKPKTISFV